MFNLRLQRRRDAHPTGFTLVELLVVSAIVALLMGMTTVALSGASEAAKRRRTRTQVAKVHELIAEKWESYETRSVSVPRARFRASANRARLEALRELMRYEIPDRVSDLFEVNSVTNNGTTSYVANTDAPRVPNYIQLPSITKYFISKAVRSNGWTTEHQGAECLYLILSRTEVGDGFALDAFPSSEIGDTDSDGMLEILDAWQQPMQFVRWPAGYTQVSAYQDPANPDLEARGTDVFDFTGIFDGDGVTYRIFPLVFSVGPDGQANIIRDGNEFSEAGGYAATNPPNNPYTDIDFNGATTKIGGVSDTSSDAHLDNITNHALGLTN